MPSSSAAASTNGLNDEPGWRCACVATSKGWLREVAPADERLDLAGARIDRDERAGRAPSA